MTWGDLVFNIGLATHSTSAPVYYLPSGVETFSKALASVAMEFNSISTWASVVNVYQEGCDSSAEGKNLVSKAFDHHWLHIYSRQVPIWK